MPWTAISLIQLPAGGFEKIAPYLTNPLVLIGFALMLVFGVYQTLLKSHLLAKVRSDESAKIIRLVLLYGFILAVLLIMAGFALQFRKQEIGTISPPPAARDPEFELAAGPKDGWKDNSFSVEIANRGGQAANSRLECFFWARGMYSGVKAEEGFSPDMTRDLSAYFKLDCGGPAGDSYNPNEFSPISELQDLDHTFHQLPVSYAGGMFSADLYGDFHLEYDDEKGNHHQKYWHMEAPLIPVGKPMLSVVEPDEFGQAKDFKPIGRAIYRLCYPQGQACIDALQNTIINSGNPEKTSVKPPQEQPAAALPN